jgi:pyruvate formate lyase activating enzyme
MGSEVAVPEGKSPYELRVNQSGGAPESFVKASLESGDVGFLHSFTTGSAVDGPGLRVVAWTAGCQWRCLYCHNPDTWSLVNGMAVPLERAVEQLKKYRHGLQVMSGGFTLSGGEPLMQDHLKTWDPERHKKLTGKDVGPTLEFARRVAGMKRPMWIRFVLVPGLTDDKENIAPIAKFVAGLGVVERVEVLPFHQMGRYKWEKLGLKYELGDVKPPTSEEVEQACEIFRKEGLEAY